jgi:WD repeat and SOF domain-containing protein 1
VKQYVRDCLEVLRVASGHDATRVRYASTDHWNYIFKEHTNPDYEYPNVSRTQTFRLDKPGDGNAGLTFKKNVKLEPLKLPEPHPTAFRPSSQQPCDPDYPRLYHMFWTGPFTDKPYMAILSFLYSQNLALNVPQGKEDNLVCRPEFWMWIKPGSAAAETSANAYAEMFDGLAANQWAAPFLHDRFKDIIKFKLWNTTEQLDGVPEIKDFWRLHTDTLFNAGGYVYKVPKRRSTSTSETSIPSMVSTNGVEQKDVTIVTPKDDDIFTRVGSQSQETYDRLSVILSDMVRFVLCHRFGGVYLDADTLLLRDWEELWGWKGAFAYRWSRLPSYNTAILRLNKGSALGSFLFKTALNNGLDFHPMTVSRYLKDAHLEELLMMLPDALFDPAWLNTEYYQLDRPPFPYFSR